MHPTPALALHEPGDYVSDEIRRTGRFFEDTILAELVRRVRVPGVIVDAGAHIGNHTAFFAEYLPHLAIHAFEPWPANLDVLRRNVARFSSVVVHDLALSDRSGLLHMVEDPNLGHVRVVQGGGYAVDASPLDALGLPLGVTLLKIDVEGHEPQVLAGAARMIDRDRPLILLEDWTGAYASLPQLAHYAVAAEWETTHQTYLYGPVQ